MRTKAGFLAVATAVILVAGSAVHAGASGDDKKKQKSVRPPVTIVTQTGTRTETPQPPAPDCPNCLFGMSGAAASAPPANGSLFSAGAPGTGLFEDFKPRRVGDLVFVDVLETSTATVASTAKRSRDSGTLGGLTTLTSALPISGAAVAGTVMQALGTRKFEGKGSTDRTSNLKARIAARVVEMLPNGDMRIEAQKLVKINKENETLTLSGIVRARDVSSDNSIPSTSVGDLHVELSGKGIASADNEPGWLYRLLEKVSPF